MITIGGALATAVLWSIAGFASAIAGRTIGPYVALAWVNGIALLLAVPAALIVDGVPHDVPASDLGWAVVFGLASAGALGCAFGSMTIGPVGLVAPVISTEGAVAALIGLALGESIAGWTGAALGIVVVGIVRSATETGADGLRAVRGANRKALLIAGAAAVLFGLTLVAGSRADALGPLWTVAISRAIGIVAFSVPVLVRARWRRPTGARWVILANAVADVTGFSLFIAATRDGVAIPAVIASQYATLIAVYGYLRFGERLQRWQWVGVALTIGGTAIVSATQQ